MLGGIAPWATRIGQDPSFLNTYPHLVGVVFLGFKEHNIVGGHDRQTQPDRQADRSMNVILLVGMPGALKFEIKPAGKMLGIRARQGIGKAGATREQGLANIAFLCARKRDKSGYRRLEPGFGDARAT